MTDASGAIIPGATIAVRSVSTGVVQSAVSGPDGAFEIRYLTPGEYVVEAAVSGFRTERRSIGLRIAQLARLNFTLQVGEIGEIIDVVARGLLLEPRAG